MRLGFRLVAGLRREDAEAVVAAVARRGRLTTVYDLWRESGVSVAGLRKLAGADAFNSMDLDRQHALWQVQELKDVETPLFEDCELRPPEIADCELKGAACDGAFASINEEVNGRDNPQFAIRNSQSFDVGLPSVPEPHKVALDYAAVGLSLRAHPVSFLREGLAQMRAAPSGELKDPQRRPAGSRVTVAGLVLVRQRPGTAAGIVFMTLEDETGVANLIIRPAVYARYRRAARHASLLLASGKVEREGNVVHVLVDRLKALDDMASDLVTHSRDFH